MILRSSIIFLRFNIIKKFHDQKITIIRDLTVPLKKILQYQPILETKNVKK